MISISQPPAILRIPAAPEDITLQAPTQSWPAFRPKGLVNGDPIMEAFGAFFHSHPTFRWWASTMEIGNGSVAPDVSLSRSAAGLLSVAGGVNISSAPQGVAPFVVAGTQPVSVAGTGTNAQGITMTAPKGGNTSGTTGQSGGSGASVTITAGNGGDAPAGATNGQGGSIHLVTGGSGSGVGNVGGTGTLNLRSTTGILGINLGRTGSNPGAQSVYMDWMWADVNPWTGQDYNIRTANDANRQFHIQSSSGHNVKMNAGAIVVNSDTAAATAVAGREGAYSCSQTINDLSQDWQAFYANAQYKRTAAGGGTGTDVHYYGVNSYCYYGGTYEAGPDATPAFGTIENFNAHTQILNCADAGSEHGLYVGFMSFYNGTNLAGSYTGASGRAWLMDLNLHTRVGRQMVGVPGLSVFANHYYNGASSHSTGRAAEAAVSIGCGQGGGGGSPDGGPHKTATSYPLNSGLHIYGRSGAIGASAATATAGWLAAIRIGNQGANSHLWTQPTKVTTGIWITDWTDYGIHIPACHANPVAGKKSIFVATDAGEAHFQDGLITRTKAGIPADADTDNDIDGHLVVDTTNNHLYFRSSGAYRRLVPA